MASKNTTTSNKRSRDSKDEKDKTVVKKTKRAAPRSYCVICASKYEGRSSEHMCQRCLATCYTCRVHKEGETMHKNRWNQPVCSVCMTTCEKCKTAGLSIGDLQQGSIYERTCMQCRENESARETLHAYARRISTSSIPFHPSRAEITAIVRDMDAVLAPLRDIYLK